MDSKENEPGLNLPYNVVWTVVGNPNGADTKPNADIKLVNETVEWMATEVKRRTSLNHHEAAKATLNRLGFQAVMGGLILVAQERHDGKGSIREVYRFSLPVLQAFLELTGKTVRWGKDDRYWVAVKPKQARRA